MNLGSIVKLARGGFSPDEAIELARGMGLDLQYQDLMDGQRPLAFQRAAVAAVELGSRAMAISGTDSQGNRVEGLLVLVPSVKLKKSA